MNFAQWLGGSCCCCCCGCCYSNDDGWAPTRDFDSRAGGLSMVRTVVDFSSRGRALVGLEMDTQRGCALPRWPHRHSRKIPSRARYFKRRSRGRRRARLKRGETSGEWDAAMGGDDPSGQIVPNPEHWTVPMPQRPREQENDALLYLGFSHGQLQVRSEEQTLLVTARRSPTSRRVYPVMLAFERCCCATRGAVKWDLARLVASGLGSKNIPSCST